MMAELLLLLLSKGALQGIILTSAIYFDVFCCSHSLSQRKLRQCLCDEDTYMWKQGCRIQLFRDQEDTSVAKVFMEQNLKYHICGFL